MNLVHMYTQLKVLALTNLGLALLSANAFAAKDYENFDLPKSVKAAIPESRLNYATDRMTLRGVGVKLKQPSINHQQFLFAKEAYISEKRDEAIKLLRQEMDSGMKANRDNMLLRLGQLYAEKYMELSYREGEVYTQQYADFEKRKETDKKAQPPKGDNSRSQAYLKDALRTFYSLEREYPKSNKIDEAIYFIGFVELESGNTQKGVAYLDRVIKNYPRSRKYDEAVLYLGDFYFDKHKFKDAQTKYRVLVARQSNVKDYAAYKLAWCELNIGSATKAIHDMKGIITRLSGNDDNRKFNLKEQALKDLVIFYGETEQVDDAMSYFSQMQGKDKALENLRLLADVYRSKARDAAAVKAYTRLINEFPSSIDTPRLYLGLYESQSRIGKTDAGVKNLMTAIEKFGEDSEWAKSFGAEKAAEVKATVETLGGEAEKIAFFHHQAGQKSANKAHYDFAIRMYSAILNHFPNHPNRKKVAFYSGEAMYAQNRFLDAANAYMIAAKMAPKDKMSDEAVYNALLALDHLTTKTDKLERYTKEEQKKVDLTPQELSQSDKRFLEIAEYYLAEYPNGERVIDVKFRVAGTYYKYRHFDEAQEKFKQIALQHPKHRSATVAAHIVLDIYNIKKDYENLHKTADMFAGIKELGDAEFRNELTQITGEIDFKKIEAVEGQNKWEEAGDSYYAFYKKNPANALAEKSLYNAYVSYEKAGVTTKIDEIAHLFIAKYPKSEYSTRMSLALAKAAERQYDFDRAQKLYEDFAKRFPKEKEAKKALYNAAVYAELLEWNQKALSLYDDYLKQGNPNAEEKKSIAISQAKIHRKEGHWDKVNVAYRHLMRDAHTQAEKAEFFAELIHQYERGGKVEERNTLMKEFRVLFAGKGVKGLGAQYLAESEFKAVVPQRERYEAVKLRFPPDDLVYLLKRKQKMLTKLSESYEHVVEIGVPEWGVAALFEKGAAYDNLVHDYRTLQIPKKYKGDELTEIQSALKNIDAQLVQPLEKKAQDVFKACMKRGADFKVASEYSSRCRDKIHVGENDVVKEPSGLIPQPNYWSTRAITEEIAKK